MSRDLSALAFGTLAAALVTAALALPTPARAGEEPASLHWHPLGEAEVLADREGKPILYFFTADWCAPCHHLKRHLFSDPEKASRIAEEFVAVEVQDTRVEKGSNLPEVDEVMQRYRVTSLPTLVVALPDGSEVGQHRGYVGAARAWTWLTGQAKAAEALIGEP